MTDFTIIWNGRGTIPGMSAEGWRQKVNPLSQMRAAVASVDDGERVRLTRPRVAVRFARCGCGKPIRKSGTTRCFVCREKDCRVRRWAA